MLAVEGNETGHVGQLLTAEPWSRAVPLVMVYHGNLGVVHYIPPSLVHAIAPIHVFEIEEEALVHRAYVGYCGGPHQHAGSQDPIDVGGNMMIAVFHEMISVDCA
jgi:hypothetical protein